MLHLLQSFESTGSRELHNILACMVESGCQPQWQEAIWQETLVIKLLRLFRS